MPDMVVGPEGHNLPSVIEENGRYFAKIRIDLSAWEHKPTMTGLWIAGFSWIFGGGLQKKEFSLYTWMEVPESLYKAMKAHPGDLPKQKGEVYER
jgi:hypothetical protein